MSTYSPDAFFVVFAVDDEPSLDQADRSKHISFSSNINFLAPTGALEEEILDLCLSLVREGCGKGVGRVWKGHGKGSRHESR